MEEGSSKLLFTGLISPYLVLLMFVIAVGLTVYLYKKHRLPRPWNVILPGLRILVLTMLLLMLLQPVWAKFSEITIRGQIPVLIDTSGSMATVDEYEKDRQIEIGWQLEFFPQKLRNTVFKEETNRWAEMDAKLLAVEKAAGGLKDVELDPEEKTDEEARKSVAAFSKDVKNLSKQFGKYREKVDKAVSLPCRRATSNRSGRNHPRRLLSTTPGCSRLRLPSA